MLRQGTMPIEKLKVLDLFSGIGGFTLGLERTGGFETIAFCEIDEFCQKILRQHWPLIPIHEDIRTLTSNDFTIKPALICGGFPCQDISVAGKQVGLDGKRSGLWFEMLRLISELRPSWVLIENVPNLRTKGADEVLSGMEAEGYTCWPTVVGAWAVGANHKRDRVWILCHSKYDGLLALEKSGCIEETIHDDTQRQKESCELTRASASRIIPFPAFRGQKQYLWESPRTIEPALDRADDGLSSRPYRIKALGNAVVPQIPELFGRFILRQYVQSI